MREETTTLCYKNNLSILLGIKGSTVWERERQESKWKLRYWPITSSLDHDMLSYLQRFTSHHFCFSAWRLLNWRPAVGSWPQRGAQPLACTSVTNCSLLATSWLQDWDSHCCISQRHLHISFHNSHMFPFNHATAFTYFHMCLVQRISDWQLGQGSVCDIMSRVWYKVLFLVFKWNQADLNSDFSFSKTDYLIKTSYLSQGY